MYGGHGLYSGSCSPVCGSVTIGGGMYVPGYGGGGLYAGAVGGTHALLSLLTRRVAAVLVLYDGGAKILGSTDGGGSMSSFDSFRLERKIAPKITKTKQMARMTMTMRGSRPDSLLVTTAMRVTFVTFVVVDVVAVVVVVFEYVVVVMVVVVVLGMQVPHSTGQFIVIDWLNISSSQLSTVSASSHTSGSGWPLQTGGMHVPHKAGHSSLINMPDVTDSWSQ